MKILLTLFVLFFSSSAVADALESCADMASKAKTNYGYKLMFGACVNEYQSEKTNFYNRTKLYKCAKKAYKLKTEKAVKTKFQLCLR
tara:strand:- start:361 stop:621 length:261 start_codon:yes stop_codon:yes gene_type:complete